MYTYPRPQNLAYPARVLFDGGRFLEAILLSDRARAGRTGAPGRSMRLVTKVERREAQRPTSLGARGWRHQLREVGTLFPPLRVPRKHSGASRRSTALATTRGQPAKLGRFRAARIQRLGCLKCG